jgi:two-component system, OmpR family, KDP operon response regulator KdpE
MKFLVVDDDLELQNTLATGLRMAWADCTVLCAEDGVVGLDYFQRFQPDLVLLDLAMPRRTGSEVLQSMRKFSDVPVLVLTGSATEIEQVRLLSQGADDFLAKPFSPAVLNARIQSLLRRTEAPPRERPQAEASLVAGELVINFERSEITLQGKRVCLTPLELRLLCYLARHAGRVRSHQEILEHVWGELGRTTPEYLKVYIGRVRRKIELGPDGPPLIENERGIGYRFVLPSRTNTAREAVV